MERGFTRIARMTRLPASELASPPAVPQAGRQAGISGRKNLWIFAGFAAYYPQISASSAFCFWAPFSLDSAAGGTSIPHPREKTAQRAAIFVAISSRMVGKLSYFQPHEGFLRECSHSYTTKKRHSVGRKEPICSHHNTRRTSLFRSASERHFLPLFAPALSPMRQSRFGDGAKGAKAENALSPFRAGAKQGIFCR